MPALAAIPWLIPLITGISAAGSLAEVGYNLANKPSTSNTQSVSTDQAKQQAAQQAAQLAAQQKTAFLAAQPNVQSQTGGSLTPTALSAATSSAAGVPSDLNSIAKYLNPGGGTSSAPISGGSITPGQNQQQQDDPNLAGLADLLKASS